MKRNDLLRAAAAGVLAAVLLCPPAWAAGSAGDVVSIALGEMGYTEGRDEYTKYGKWYGHSRSYWCDMFISWCADQAGVPPEAFPADCSCTSHMQAFRSMGVYHDSASRGGDYVPKQGDVIFFYEPLRSPKGTWLCHTGLVLYVENGFVYTVEGNTEAHRLDYPYEELRALMKEAEAPENPDDYVLVDYYPLDDPYIHGYAAPQYEEGVPLELEGFVDLGQYEELREQFEYLAAQDVMPGTSAHTFSPTHGMSRREFLTCVARLCGLPEWEEAELERPERYISGEEAQEMLSQAMDRLGLELEEFSFSEGHFSYAGGSFTIRADLAQALYALASRLPAPEPFDGKISLGNWTGNWSLLSVNGSCYVRLADVQKAYTALKTEQEALPPEASARVQVEMLPLEYRDHTGAVPMIWYEAERYVQAEALADLMSVKLKYK